MEDKPPIRRFNTVNIVITEIASQSLVGTSARPGKLVGSRIAQQSKRDVCRSTIRGRQSRSSIDQMRVGADSPTVTRCPSRPNGDTILTISPYSRANSTSPSATARSKLA
jgi:hypothetical protein